jgi:hypothetical protein
VNRPPLVISLGVAVGILLIGGQYSIAQASDDGNAQVPGGKRASADVPSAETPRGGHLRAEVQALLAKAAVWSHTGDTPACMGSVMGVSGTALWHPSPWFGVGASLRGLRTTDECEFEHHSLGTPLTLRFAVPLDSRGQELHLLAEVGPALVWSSDEPFSVGRQLGAAIGYRSPAVLQGARVVFDLGWSAEHGGDYNALHIPLLRLGASWDL